MQLLINLLYVEIWSIDLQIVILTLDQDIKIPREVLNRLKHDWNYKNSSNLLMMHNMNTIDYISDELADQRKRVKRGLNKYLNNFHPMSQNQNRKTHINSKNNKLTHKMKNGILVI